MPCSAQLILGTDKRNPLFTVYRDSRREKVLVYYGFELMEVLPEEPNHPAFKLMIARLYNAGIKAKSLCEAFAVDLKTIRRWARALLCADAQNLIRVLEGPSARRKFTVQVEAFVRMRWPEVTAGGAYGAVGRLREEIKAVFRVDISAVTLRPLIRQLKVQSAIPCPPSAPADSPGSAPPMGGGDPEEKREQPCGSSPLDADASKHSNSLPCTPLDTETPLKPPLDNRNHAPVFPSRQPEGSYWCDHAGVLIFAPILSRVTGLFDPSQGLLSQWLASLWLGALNIEQTKFLNWEDLEGILGSVVRFPSPQRERLKALATDATVEELLRFNLEESGQGQATDFYFDPHSKHYTLALTRMDPGVLTRSDPPCRRSGGFLFRGGWCVKENPLPHLDGGEPFR